MDRRASISGNPERRSPIARRFRYSFPVLKHPYLQLLMRTTPSWGPTLLRVALGVMIAAHGSHALFDWFAKSGLESFPHFLASSGSELGRGGEVAEGLIQLACGLLLVIGFQTRVAAAVLTVVMAVIAHHAYNRQGFLSLPLQTHWEYPGMCAVAFFVLVVMGGGAMSLDERFSGGGPRGR